MNLKYQIGIIATLVIGAVSVSCNDDFMDRHPESSITKPSFFNNVKDLETYTNGFYGIIGSSYSDGAGDNLTDNDSPAIYALMRGEVTPKTQGQWSWDNVRSINYFIENYHTATGDKAEINHYLGIARLFRAYHYYGKVRSYSDVPWYSRTLQTSDTELLYKPQDSRKLVVDSIMSDLEFAANNIRDVKTKTRINKWVAKAIQARIALDEGTFRKYHGELGLTDSDRFLKIARDAAAEIFINNNEFSLHTEKTDLDPYESLFSSLNLSNNTEIIMYDDYEKGIRMHNAQALYNNYYGLSRDLMEDYLVVDGNTTRFFHTVPNYDEKTFLEVFENRDPRIKYTFMQPGDIRIGASEPTRPKLGIGGYVQVKFAPLSFDQIDWGKSYSDLPIIRLAEMYLVYVEARAELGELTQNDINITINLLRDRVGMPHMQLANILANVDHVQAERYPNVSGAQKGAILEVRRERRIELACEGFRKNDVFRWKAGKRYALPFEGIYVPQLGYLDVTGDGNPDIAIVQSQAEANAIPDEDKIKYKLVVYILAGNTFYLSEGDHGFVRVTALKDKLKFEEPKYYYTPIAEKDIVINENLYQNPFWK